MRPHAHRFTIADPTAVEAYVEKLSGWNTHQRRREKLLEALHHAAGAGRSSRDKERRAFFHGLLTGYAVALKLW